MRNFTAHEQANHWAVQATALKQKVMTAQTSSQSIGSFTTCVIDRWMDGWKCRWVETVMDGWKHDGYKNGWMEGWIEE